MERAVALHHDHLVLGRYRPLRPLGSGGSGSVWLVRDERSDHDVALKVVPREGKAGSRAEREVEAAARLRHPRCLRALALEQDDRHVYVAYEYIPGRTLRQALRHGELDDADAVEAGAQVLEALAHAHGKGVVHRDVKPANVMLEESEDVSVRVLDFGLAQLEEADTLTAVGDVPGTLAYIAPERLAGHDATGAADVWSVGVFLWEALAGRHPFWAISPLETARRVAAGAPSLVTLRPDLPRRLTTTVDAMLSSAPGHRPQAKEAAADLRTSWSARSERQRGTMSRTRLAERAGPAALAAVYGGSAAWLLPFFPSGWPFLAAAVVVSALTETPLPFIGEEPPETLGLAESPHPGRALDAINAFFSAHPALWIEAAVLAAATVAAPYARARGLWGIAGWGAAFLAAAVLAPLGAVSAFPLALWVWAGAALLAVPVLRTRR
jgi:hypothetical protein